jgi:hypothetical protein
MFHPERYSHHPRGACTRRIEGYERRRNRNARRGSRVTWVEGVAADTSPSTIVAGTACCCLVPFAGEAGAAVTVELKGDGILLNESSSPHCCIIIGIKDALSGTWLAEEGDAMSIWGTPTSSMEPPRLPIGDSQPVDCKAGSSEYSFHAWSSSMGRLQRGTIMTRQRQGTPSVGGQRCSSRARRPRVFKQSTTRAKCG